MTIRELVQSYHDRMDAFWVETSTQHVLDWSISNLLLAVVLAVFGIFVFASVLEMIANFFGALARAWEKVGLSTLFDRLRKRYGPIHATLIMVAGTFASLVTLSVVLTILDISTRP